MRFLPLFVVATVAAAAATVYLPSAHSAKGSSVLDAITMTKNILVVPSVPSSSPSSESASPITINPSESLLNSEITYPTFVLAVPSSVSRSDRPSMTSETFPLPQLASTAKTILVSDGFNEEAVQAFSQKGHKVIRAHSVRDKFQFFSTLSNVLNIDISASDNGFSVEQAKFTIDDVDAVFGPVVALLDLSPSDISLRDASFVVADLSSGYSEIVSTYGAKSNQAIAAKAVIEAAVAHVEKVFGNALLFASDKLVLDDMETLETFDKVSSFVVNSLPKPKKNTAITQLFIWFHVALWITFALVIVFTIKLGLDIEKDTLLYRTTALRG